MLLSRKSVAVVAVSGLSLLTFRSSNSVEALASSGGTARQTAAAFSRSANHQVGSGNRSGHISRSQLGEKRAGTNPFQSMFGDMASSLKSTLAGGPGGSNLDIAALDQKLAAALAAMEGGSTWDDIKSDLEGQQSSEEKAFRSNVAKGIGAPSPLNKIRLFDESNKEEDIRVTLYRDHASWCPYCQKVWMTLEEKRIPYKVEKINMRCYGEKPASFNRLQPSGAIPVAIIDGKVYNQSNDIIYTLESTFSTPAAGGDPDKHKPLLPPQDDTELRMTASRLLKLERTLFSAWMYWLTGSERSKGNFINVLQEVEKELTSSKGGDFFLGPDVSLVDFMFAPFLERTAASMMFFKGYQIRVAKGAKTEYPAINKWFDAMETLSSYTLTKSDYYTHSWDLPPQLGGCISEKDGEPYERAINGEKTIDGLRGSWELPLERDLGGIEPDWDWVHGGDKHFANREAVERLSFNSHNIVAFAARGAGSRGMPGYMAPLSDPNAKPNDGVKGSVDACLRIVSLAMLNGTEKYSDDIKIIVNVLKEEGGSEHVENVIASLAYLRDRVGVPRDMRLPAARTLRAHLNWFIEKML